MKEAIRPAGDLKTKQTGQNVEVIGTAKAAAAAAAARCSGIAGTTGTAGGGANSVGTGGSPLANRSMSSAIAGRRLTAISTTSQFTTACRGHKLYRIRVA